jgi:hypothetical protein
MLIVSPGLAPSIAVWMDCPAVTLMVAAWAEGIATTSAPAPTATAARMRTAFMAIS